MQSTTTSQVSLISMSKDVPSKDAEISTTSDTGSVLSMINKKLHLGKRNWPGSAVLQKGRKIGVVEVNPASQVTGAFSDNLENNPKISKTSFVSEGKKSKENKTAKQNHLPDTAVHIHEDTVEQNGLFADSFTPPATAPKLSKPLFKFKSFKFGEKSLKQSEKPKQSKFKLTHQNSFQKFGHLSLLTPALVLEPTVHGKDVFTKQFSKSLDEDFLQLAASHIKDAINGHGKFGEARAIFKPLSVQRCFKVLSSRIWAALLYLTIAVHSLMLLWEQPSQPVAIGQEWVLWKMHPVVLCVNAVCLLIYTTDLILHTFFLTLHNIWVAKEKVWVRLEFVFTFFFIVDFIILVAEAATNIRLLCPFRCFRASMLLCKSKNVAHIFNVLLSIISKLGKVLLIIAIFIVTFASIGLHVFMNDYHSLPSTCCNGTTSWNCSNIYSGAFDQVASAAMHMFVLMSTENYPEFIIPAFNKSWANFFYFGLYLYAGVFFLTAILLAIIVESYWDYSKRHVKQERRQQREELAKAWNLMDPLGNGQLPVDDPKLLKLFRILKPQNSDEENQELINYISMYGDGVIDSYDWTTKLIETLSYVFEEEPKANKTDNDENQINHVVLQKIQNVCKDIIHAKAASVVVLSLIFIHSILFCLTWYGIPDIVQLAIQSTKTSIVAIFVIEFILRTVADGKNLLNVFDILDMSMVIFAIVGSVTWHVLFSIEPKVDPVYLGACAVVSGLAVLIRAVFNSQHARTAVAVLRNIYPVMFDLILLVITIIFFYAVLGLEIFQNNTLTNSSRQGYEGSYVEYGCGVGFETFGCALLIVFQIVTTNDWHEIMLGAILDSGWPSVFYFISCYLIVDMIVMNLFVAISIEAYKKLAIDNNTLDSVHAIDDDPQDPHKHENTSLKSAAKNTLREIFASSRNPRLSVGSGTLNDFASSPYSVRRGTLGSLGARTPTPTPRLEHGNLSSEDTVTSINGKTISPRRKPSLKVEEPTRKISTGEGSGIDRRQKALKQRQDKRRKERRQTKQEEKKIADALKKEENKLQIESVVRLKKAVQVIKAFHARNVREMTIHEGDVLPVSEQTQNMYLGPNGWFPADHVVAVAASNGTNAEGETSSGLDEDSSHKQNHVKFNVSPAEVKKQPPSPHHRISQTRIRKRNDGADWRRQILGDITIMNQDELNALSGKFKGGLGRRHNSHMRNSTYQLPKAIHEELSEEEEEQVDKLSNLPRLTVSEVNETNIDEDDPSDTHTDTNTLTLPEASPRGGMSTRRKNSAEMNKGQNPPDWVEKFANKNKIMLDKDVKLAE